MDQRIDECKAALPLHLMQALSWENPGEGLTSSNNPHPEKLSALTPINPTKVLEFHVKKTAIDDYGLAPSLQSDGSVTDGDYLGRC